MQNKFSPSEAATSFFSFFQAHPKFVLRYIALYAAFTLVIMGGFAAGGYFDFMGQIMALSQGGKEPSPEKMLALFSGLNAPIIIVLIIFSVVLSIALITMGLRKTVRNEEIGYYGITWGNDENQFLIAGLQIFLMWLGVCLAMGIIGGILAMVNPGLIALLFIAMPAALIIGVGRFGMYGVLTIANRKAGAMASLNYTKEQFWSFVGAFVLNGIIVLIISAIIQAILGGIFSPFMTDAIGGMPSSLAGFFSIGSILYFVAVGAVGGASRLAMFCAGSYAYHKISENQQSE